MLTERGWSLAAAGSATSLFMWLGGVSVPLGGVAADRTGLHAALMLAGFALFGAGLIIAARTDHIMLAFAALGLVSGLSAGPIMGLPARVLGPDTRAAGMGLFFTIFYAMVVLGPIAAGWVADLVGTSRIAFDIGALLLAGCFIAHWVFEAMCKARRFGAGALTRHDCALRLGVYPWGAGSTGDPPP